jgi:hypothetical protein
MGNMFCSAPPSVSIPIIETIEETKEEPKEVVEETKEEPKEVLIKEEPKEVLIKEEPKEVLIKEEPIVIKEEIKDEPIVVKEEIKEEPIVIKEEIKTEEVSVILDSNTDNKIQEDVKIETLENIPSNNECSLSDTSSTTSSLDNTIKEDEPEPAKKKRGRKKKGH